MEEVTRLFHSLLSTGKMGMNHSDFLNRTAVLYHDYPARNEPDKGS